MSDENNIISIATMPNDEILELMQEDLYDGYADEIVEEVEELLARGMEPYEILTKGLVAGMDIVGISTWNLEVRSVTELAGTPSQPVSLQRALPTSFGSGRVDTIEPRSVKSTVCSKCADQRPSAVTTVQSSSSVTVASEPRLNMGSSARAIPCFSLNPLPALP